MTKRTRKKFDKFVYHFTKMCYLFLSWILIAIGVYIVYMVEKATREYIFFYGIITGIILLFTLFLVVFVDYKEVKK